MGRGPWGNRADSWEEAADRFKTTRRHTDTGTRIRGEEVGSLKSDDSSSNGNEWPQ